MVDDPIKALIVDDDEVARKMLSFALKREGIAADHAIDGADALGAMDQSAYDLVVTDLLMPNTHGHALSVELLERAVRPIIVIHTSILEPKLVRDLMLRGVDDIVFKPCDYTILAAKVKCLVQRRRKLQLKLMELMNFLGSGAPVPVPPVCVD